jgi:ketosteroid isomerase-like protein
MSQQNVELVTRLQVAPEVDLAAVFRSDEMWSAMTDSVDELFHPDCRCVAPGVPGTEAEHVGLDGLRSAWLQWLEPWLTYRTEIEQAIDGGDRVLLLTRDYGRRAGSEHEIKVDGSAVWTVSDGKISRAEFFAHRADAFQAAGLPEQPPLTDAR